MTESWNLGKNAHELNQVSQLELEEILTRFGDNSQTNEDEEKLVEYCICDLTQSDKKDFTTEDIENRMRDLVIGHCLRSLSEQNLLDVSIDDGGEAYYSISKKGKEYVEEIDSR